LPYENYPDMNDATLRQRSIERAETIPSSWYVDSRMHELDRKALMSISWQYTGPSECLSENGAVFSTEVAGQPVLILRDGTGKLCSFYNVCRHRGGPLVTQDTNVKALQCKYHGWTYNLKGELRATPQMDGIEHFDKKDFCLKRISVDEWEGMLFINLNSRHPALRSLMEGIRERITPIKLGKKKYFRRVSYEINCNWKVYVDNYLEGYHLPYVHPTLTKMLDYRQYAIEIYQHYSLQYSPFSENKNPFKTSDGEAYYYFIFPNFMLNILPGRLQTNCIIPLSTGKCLVHFDYYYDDSTPADIIEADIRYSDQVQSEDINICEKVQKGLASNAYDRGRFSPKEEKAVHHFQSMLKYAYQDYFKNIENLSSKKNS